MLYTDNKNLDKKFREDNGLLLCIVYCMCYLGEDFSKSLLKGIDSWEENYSLEETSKYKSTPNVVIVKVGDVYMVEDGNFNIIYSPTRVKYNGERINERYIFERIK